MTVRNPAGGQPAGAIELLKDPVIEFLEEAYVYAADAFGAKGISLDSVMPFFMYSLMQARIKASAANKRRSEMPVIDEADLPALKQTLLTGGYLDLCEACTVTPATAKPSQCQIYVDKSVDGTVKFGMPSTMDFLLGNHLIMSRDGFIIDGHHRWLTAYFIDPDMVLPAFKAPADLADIWDRVLDFSDQRHARNG